jgi:hypothetical protein
MFRRIAAVIWLPALLASTGAAAGSGERPFETASAVSEIGVPIGVTLDRQQGLPPVASDSEPFQVPSDQRLVLDHVGVRATFDPPLPEGGRYVLLMNAGGLAGMPIGFGEVVDGQILFSLPLALVVQGSVNFAILSSFSGAEVTSARYNVAGRLVPAVQ